MALTVEQMFLDFVVHLAPLGQTSAVDEEAMMLTRMILNALQLSNFALNFFLYCTLNAQFRRAFVDWFCRRKRKRRADVRRAALGVDAAGKTCGGPLLDRTEGRSEGCSGSRRCRRGV